MARLFDDASSEYLYNNTGVLTVAPITISCWFRFDVDIERSLFTLCNGGNDTDYFQLAADADQKVYVVATDVGGYEFTYTINTFSVGDWSHALGVFAASNDRRVYLNGTGKGTGTNSITPSGINRIGVGFLYRQTPTSYMSGDIAEVALWNIALTDAEAVSLAKGFSPLLIRPSNLVGCWPLIRGLNDKIANNTLTATGTTVANHPGVFNPYGES